MTDRGTGDSLRRARDWTGRAVSYARAHIDVIAVFLASGCHGAFTWLLYGWRPRSWSPAGYLDWADQRSYRVEMEYLAQFALPQTPGEYLRGLGYPLVGVPFEWIGFPEPFLPANLLMLAVAVAAFYVVARRLSNHRAIPPVLVLVLLLATPLVTLSVVPWSTTVTTVSFALALVIATSPRGPSVAGAVGLGMLAGWTFAARYLDVLVIGAIAIWYFVVAARVSRARRFVAMAIPGLSWLAAVLLSHLAVHGSLLSTGYTLHRGNPQSLGYYDITRIPIAFWETFVSGVNGAEGRVREDPLLLVTPLLIAAPVGAVMVLVATTTRLRGLHVAAIAGTAVQGAIYLAGEFGGAAALGLNSPRFWISSYGYWLLLALVALAAAWRWLSRIRTRAREDAEPLQSAQPSPEAG